MTTVVNVRDSKADVYIGRGSKWGNPFKMESEADRDKVCEQYEVYFWTSGLFRDINELVDKSLGCYCKPKRCHGDFLAEIAEFYKSHGYVNKSDFEASRKGAPHTVSKGDKIMQFRGKYWFLSNFYPCKITDPRDNLTFECVESAFQASKCAFPEDRKKFLGLNGAEAKKLGRSIRLRSDWDSIKVDRMCEFVSYKFYDEKLLKMLKAIDEPIVENNTWNDTFWGVCNGKGRNELGAILEYIKKGNSFDPVAGWLPTNEDNAIREKLKQSHYKFIKVDGEYVLKASK